MKQENGLIQNIDKIRTTPPGAERIKRNLDLSAGDVVAWCRAAIEKADIIIGQGKNWYAYKDDAVITINAKSFTIITAHKLKEIHVNGPDRLTKRKIFGGKYGKENME